MKRNGKIRDWFLLHADYVGDWSVSPQSGMSGTVLALVIIQAHYGYLW
jgi:hypothetical protein